MKHKSLASLKNDMALSDLIVIRWGSRSFFGSFVKYFSRGIGFFFLGYFGVFVIALSYNFLLPQPSPIYSADAQSLKPNAITTVKHELQGAEIKSRFDIVPSSGGKTGGAFIEFDNKIERLVSGKKITVEIEVTSVGNAIYHQFAVAYSTNTVGNSGWRKFPIKRGKNKYRFDFQVPKDPNAGKTSDYLGVLSDFSGIGTEIIFNSLNVYLRG